MERTDDCCRSDAIKSFARFGVLNKSAVSQCCADAELLVGL